MKTVEEILKYMQRSDDLFGFKAQAVVGFLTFEEAKPMLQPEAKKEDWVEPTPRTEEAVKKVMQDYMEFAWGKVEDHRGISADRSIRKMEAWLWLLGDEATLKALDEASYQNYGAPKLAVVCRAYGFSIPPGENVQRMIQRLPCSPDCSEGCGW